MISCIVQGEIALIDPNQRRTANVVTSTTVTCMTLSRATFNEFFHNIRTAIMQHSMAKNGIAPKPAAHQTPSSSSAATTAAVSISKHRCVTARSGEHESDLLRSVLRFMRDSLCLSLYHRLYRDLLLHPERVAEAGDGAGGVMGRQWGRLQSISAFRGLAMGVLRKEPELRTASDHKLIIALLRQRNALFHGICKDWMPYQYSDLCRRARLLHIDPLRKVLNSSAVLKVGAMLVC